MSLFVCVVSVVCLCLGVVFDVSNNVIAFCSQLVVSAVGSVWLFSERDGHEAQFFAC
jgi:hypothetical protein